MIFVKTRRTARKPSRPSVQALRRAHAASAPAGRPRAAAVSVAALIASPSGPVGPFVRPGRTASAALSASAADDLGRDVLGHRRVRLEVVRGAQQRRLVRVRHVDLGDDAAAEDDDRPVADELDLLQLGGVEQDRGAGLGEVAEQHVDLALGADVDAARRVEAEHRLHAARRPSARSSPSAGCRRTAAAPRPRPGCRSGAVAIAPRRPSVARRRGRSGPSGGSGS